ncbi:MAG TPA: hypothetical protein ENI81_06145, partial [Phycisphaerales bacterium]|nr:hypothetical protein [Phycisphaerales bacterium]
MYKKLILLYVIAGMCCALLCGVVLGADKEADRSIQVKKLSLSPAAEPVPALAYRLLPRQLDKKTGNAALLYATAAALCPDGDSEELHDKIDKWQDMAVEDLPRKEVERALSSFSGSFHHIALAAYRTDCRWESPVEDGFSMQIPHLSTFRSVVRAMRLQIRLKIADGQTDQAMEMLQHCMQMGRNIAEGPTLIQDLVGTAIVALSLGEVENLMQRPDSPNMYWALTALPDPMIDMYSSLEYEREAIFVEFPALRNLEDEVLTPAQASGIISDFGKKMHSLNESDGDVPFGGVLPLGWVMMHYSDAKQFLADKGFSQQRIEAMPAAQAVLIYQKQEYLEMRDNLFKWFAIPYHQSRAYVEQNEKTFSRHRRDKGLKMNLFTILLPALSRVSFLQARLDRHVAILRTVEA